MTLGVTHDIWLCINDRTFVSTVGSWNWLLGSKLWVPGYIDSVKMGGLFTVS